MEKVEKMKKMEKKSQRGPNDLLLIVLNSLALTLTHPDRCRNASINHLYADVARLLNATATLQWRLRSFQHAIMTLMMIQTSGATTAAIRALSGT